MGVGSSHSSRESTKKAIGVPPFANSRSLTPDEDRDHCIGHALDTVSVQGASSDAAEDTTCSSDVQEAASSIDMQELEHGLSPMPAERTAAIGNGKVMGMTYEDDVSTDEAEGHIGVTEGEARVGCDHGDFVDDSDAGDPSDNALENGDGCAQCGREGTDTEAKTIKEAAGSEIGEDASSVRSREQGLESTVKVRS